MTIHAIAAKRIFDGVHFHHDAALVWQGQRIMGLVPRHQLSLDVITYDYPDATLTPGFIDLQVNGGGGVMFNTQTDVVAMEQICHGHRKHGTAHLLPTLISDTPEQLKRALKAAEAALNDKIPGVLGVHLEGPWLNSKKKGAHNNELFYAPTIAELETFPWPEKAKVLITLAPEQIEAEVLQWLHQQDIALFCGHSNARHEQLTSKLQYLHGFTHLYNAMSPFEGREPGVVGTALMADNQWCSIIADGIHVHPQSVLLAQRMKPHGKLLFVTDAMATVGSDQNSFELNGETIQVVDNALVNGKGNLAGAHIGMDQSVINLIEWGVAEEEALRMASTYPAEAIGLTDLGYLRPDYRASVTILRDDYSTQAVLVDGTLFEQ
ncbi:TPA: N-acetylglucosamine-6-phosphate deacetylase [Vibrio vulnificus]|nr:N-acetylglucosamine-6-phosphate deacetylase [Vibrio vulnificus]HDY8059157.1 N-acetylglucosamine-6-phosphate deacetylase [Vibrio vulnificus]HDY8078357.1 N-acetylglucosamine-6-phosphate deacetylase [Vibrio vulnificus]HDY8188920.1 N-acetylglucosamine-6-phosphate deacetylase [Vibrio vulnificus]